MDGFTAIQKLWVPASNFESHSYLQVSLLRLWAHSKIACWSGACFNWQSFAAQYKLFFLLKHCIKSHCLMWTSAGTWVYHLKSCKSFIAQTEEASSIPFLTDNSTNFDNHSLWSKSEIVLVVQIPAVTCSVWRLVDDGRLLLNCNQSSITCDPIVASMICSWCLMLACDHLYSSSFVMHSQLWRERRLNWILKD